MNKYEMLETVQDMVEGRPPTPEGKILTTLDVDKQLRKQFEIPEEYVTLEFEDDYYYHISKKIPPSMEEFNCEMDDTGEIYIGLDLKKQSYNSFIKGEYFTACNLSVFPSRNGPFGRLFIEKKNIGKFFDDFFKGEVPVKRAMPLVSNGVYNIKVKPFVGLQLCDVNVADIEPPILNDNLMESLTKEILMFKSKQDFYEEHNIEYKRGILMYGPAGNGKCHGKGTEILMHNGDIKKVEDIKIGEFIMGNDSTPRKVLSLGRGVDQLYEIHPTKGKPFTVNSNHLLSLKMNGDVGKNKKSDIVNIPIKQYLNESNHFKKCAKGYRTKIDFDEQLLAIDPYMLGIWLGDGTTSKPDITTMDEEVVTYINTFAKENKWVVNKYKSDTKANTYAITTGSKENSRNGTSFKSLLKRINVLNNKHVPRNFKINSAKHRLQMLAGLIDSDGYYKDNCYYITQKSNQLSSDIIFLAQTLGLGVTHKKEIKTIKSTGFSGEYNMITIYGNIDIIPVKVLRKKAVPRKQIKNVLHFGFDVIKKEVGDYYGFELDGNHLYCLGDCTVTHNTSFIKTFVKDFDAISVLLNIKSDNEISFIEKFLGDPTYKDKLKIIIMEDIDGIQEHMRSSVLNLLDGVSACNNTIFIATTNFPNKLDIAIAKRPSRFDSLYNIEVPNESIRKELLSKFFKDIDTVELAACVEESAGLSGAYFKEIFLFSMLNDLEPLEAIVEIKKRMKIFDKTESYIG